MNVVTIESVSQLNDLAAAGRLVGLFNVPIELYHQGPGISSTGLKEILKSPAHYRAYIEEERDTEALMLGRVTHLAVLEPDVYAETVVVPPPCDRRTKEGKAAWEHFQATTVGKVIVNSSMALQATQIRDAVRSNALAGKLLSGGAAEISAYWIDPRTGVLCKARADYLTATGLIVDLKTCQNARQKAFTSDVFKYQYHLSAAFYLDGFASVMGRGMKGFAWIAAEKARPFGVGFYAADTEVLTAGRARYLVALERYAECLRTKSWPCYDEEFQNVTLPNWYDEEEIA